MKVKTQDYNDVTVVELQGDLDRDSTALFLNTVNEIIAASKGGVVFDMNKVGFIDSEGLERLLWAQLPRAFR